MWQNNEFKIISVSEVGCLKVLFFFQVTFSNIYNRSVLIFDYHISNIAQVFWDKKNGITCWITATKNGLALIRCVAVSKNFKVTAKFDWVVKVDWACVNMTNQWGRKQKSFAQTGLNSKKISLEKSHIRCTGV